MYNLLYFFIAVFFIILIFTFIRALILWYYNLDKILFTLEEIRDELKKK